MARKVSNKKLQEKEESAAKNGQYVAPVVVDRLANHIRMLWSQAKEAKRPTEQQILKNIRQRNGEYESDKLNAIKQLGGSEVFMQITGIKCWHAKAWIRDIMFQPGMSSIFELEPTPAPELPPEEEAAIAQSIVQETIKGAIAQIMQTGIPPDPNTVAMLQADLASSLANLKDRIQRELFAKAKEKAKEFKVKVNDALVEGGYYKVLADSLDDIINKTGITKGPIKRNEPKMQLVQDPMTGEIARTYIMELIDTYERRNPLDIYPAPDSIDIDDGYLIDKITVNAHDLSAMIGVPNYSEKAIKHVLSQHHGGALKEWTEIDQDRTAVEDKDTSAKDYTEKIDILEFWGFIKGALLLEWGMKEEQIPEPLYEYPVIADLVKDVVIMATLNPDPKGKKPYSKCSFVESPDSFWGIGLPEKISDVQQLCNQAARAIGNNVGYASGPQVEVCRDELEPGANAALWPLKVWYRSASAMKEGPVVVFNYPKMVAQELMMVYDFFSKKADEHSGIPAYAHGDPSVGGGGSTASGLSMLYTSAARGIKDVIKNIDENMVELPVTRQYFETLVKEKDLSSVPDFKIVAKGSSSLIAKEQQVVRRAEILRDSNNPMDVQIIGIEGRREMWKETLRSLEMDADKIIPDRPQLALPFGPMGAQNLPPSPAPAALTPSGVPQGGAENRLFTNYGGR